MAKFTPSNALLQPNPLLNHATQSNLHIPIAQNPLNPITPRYIHHPTT